MNTTKRAVCYLRVSTKDQETLNQRRLLEEVAKQRGWEIISFYEDDGISGDGKKSRQAFNQLLKDATQGKFDVVMAYDVSRVSRNLESIPFLVEILTCPSRPHWPTFVVDRRHS